MDGGVHYQARVLFVCLGNICRSPMAEGAFRAAALRHGLEWDVDSAGTAAYHIGQAPDPRAIAAARAHGVDISEQRARQIAHDDFFSFTHVFAMDNANLAGLKSQLPRDTTAHIALLNDSLPGREGLCVVDPYYGDEALFARVWSEIAEATEALAARFARDGLNVRI